MNRLVVFAHYDRDNKVDDYVYYYLLQLREISKELVFVTTSNISDGSINRLKVLCSKVIVRENSGHDFLSYKVGIECADFIKFDEVVLCNDSVYGPFYPLDNIFKLMKDKDCSFWGMTHSEELSYHLQSYFLVFRKSIVTSLIFHEFWESVTALKTRKQIIYDNEVGLSRLLLESGFKAESFVNYKPNWRDCIRESVVVRPWVDRFIYLLKIFFKSGVCKCNVTHVFWKKIILNHKMPFIKVDLLRDNYLHFSDVKQYKEVIFQEGRDYPVGFIEKHLLRMGRKSDISD